MNIDIFEHDFLSDVERVELTTASSFAEELVGVDSTKVLSLRNIRDCSALHGNVFLLKGI